MLLGDIIKNYRKEHNMSLQDFADLIQTSRSYVHMLEKNFNPSTGKPISPSIETLRSISNAMNISIEELIKQLDAEQYIYLTEDNYIKQFQVASSSDYTIDITGLTKKDIEQIKRFIEFIKKEKQDDKNK